MVAQEYIELDEALKKSKLSPSEFIKQIQNNTLSIYLQLIDGCIALTADNESEKDFRSFSILGLRFIQPSKPLYLKVHHFYHTDISKIILGERELLRISCVTSGKRTFLLLQDFDLEVIENLTIFYKQWYWFKNKKLHELQLLKNKYRKFIRRDSFPTLVQDLERLNLKAYQTIGKSRIFISTHSLNKYLNQSNNIITPKQKNQGKTISKHEAQLLAQQLAKSSWEYEMQNSAIQSKPLNMARAIRLYFEKYYPHFYKETRSDASVKKWINDLCPYEKSDGAPPKNVQLPKIISAEHT